MARAKPIPVSEIRKISQLQLTEGEAASFFKISLSTFREMLRVDIAAKAAWEEGRNLGKIGLRRRQIALASSSAPMAIWLGKQWLGQSDISTIQHTGADGGPIKTLDLTQLSADQRKNLREALTTARKK